MKRVISLLAVLMILVLSAVPIAAAAKPADSPISAIRTDRFLADNAAERAGQEDFRIDLDLATTLIITISAVLIILIFAFVIVMGLRNRPKP